MPAPQDFHLIWLVFLELCFETYSSRRSTFPPNIPGPTAKYSRSNGYDHSYIGDNGKKIVNCQPDREPLTPYGSSSMDLNASFQPGQIVDLKHGEFCLYAEVIQVVTERQICWVRPLLLLKFSGDLDQPNPAFYNLHHSPDLIWPIELFQPTLDTEVIPWLAQLNSDAAKITDDSSAHVQLRGLIDQIWQNFTDAFD